MEHSAAIGHTLATLKISYYVNYMFLSMQAMVSSNMASSKKWHFEDCVFQGHPRRWHDILRFLNYGGIFAVPSHFTGGSSRANEDSSSLHVDGISKFWLLCKLRVCVQVVNLFFLFLTHTTWRVFGDERLTSWLWGLIECCLHCWSSRLLIFIVRLREIVL